MAIRQEHADIAFSADCSVESNCPAPRNLLTKSVEERQLIAWMSRSFYNRTRSFRRILHGLLISRRADAGSWDSMKQQPREMIGQPECATVIASAWQTSRQGLATASRVRQSPERAARLGGKLARQYPAKGDRDLADSCGNARQQSAKYGKVCPA